MVGESWAYYILGSVIEVVLLLTIARTAWTWPRRPRSDPRAQAATPTHPLDNNVR